MGKIGKNSTIFNNVYLGSSAVITGPKEKAGPLSYYFDKKYDDLRLECDSWEKAEMKLFKEALDVCLLKNKLSSRDIDYVVFGDLNNQIIIGNYVLRDYDIPYLGVFGACSTSVESIIVGGNLIEAESASLILAGTSSHYSTSERQFRYPTEYGGQKPNTTTSTVTAGGVVLLTNSPTDIKVTAATVGKVIDAKIKDPLDMGRAMAPAAYSTLKQHFDDFNTGPEEYDLIVTGDLSYYGKDLLIKIFAEDNVDMSKNYNDCGLMIYDRNTQDVHAGGSGCACCAAVTYGYLLSKLRDNSYKKVLVVATGALLNPIIMAQKESIPCIAHAIVIERS